MNKRGFTLIEVLLGFLVFGLVMGAVVSVFWAGLRMNERGAKQNKVAEEARRTLEWLVQDLENMVDFDMTSISQDRNAFVGEKNKITFVWPSGKGLKSVRYYLEEPSQVRVFQTIIGETSSKNIRVTQTQTRALGTQYLIREVKDFSSYLSGTTTPGEKEVLFTHTFTDGIVFKYAYAKSKESREIDWRDKWEEAYMPLAIEVDLSFQEYPDAEPKTLVRKILIPAGTFGGIQKDKQSQVNQTPTNIFQNLFQNVVPPNGQTNPNGSTQQAPNPFIPDTGNDVEPTAPAAGGQNNGGSFPQMIQQLLHQRPSQ